MCGICGFITKRNIADAAFDGMVDSLIHRGPDDRGTYRTQTSDDWNIALGHRRLSILDCSPNGHQPMRDKSSRYIIVFNGEIYNFSEIKTNLHEFEFTSTSDTEVLLYAYIKYGTDCLQHLNGMFAFAIYDKLENTLFMARDRMGEKPLYYFYDGEQLVFASELKAIIKYPYFTKTINKDVLIQYFSQSCILPPNTIFENTFKLSAGQSLLWKDGRIETKTYYSLVDSYFQGKENQIADYASCKKQLKDLLYDSIEKRLVADVPVGTFLSGGIDSTLVSAIANDIRSDSKIDTFTIGFNEKEFDESSFAKQSAKHLGTRHHEQIMSEDALFEMLADLTTYYDEPFSDSSQLPTMLVSKFAREHVTVVLSGDGGDELFAGYSNIDTLTKLKKLDAILTPARAIIPNGLYNNLNSDATKILLGKMHGQEKIQYYAKLREGIAKGIINTDSQSESFKGTISNARIANEPWLQQRMLFDMTSYLPDEIMTKTDRASMRFSLEMRCPMLDHRIVDFAMRVPMEYKYRDGIKKYILKDILYDYIPKEMMDRPKKGFGVPIGKWLNNELSSQLNKSMAKEFVAEQGLFDHSEIQKLADRAKKYGQTSDTQVLWGYYVFQAWYEKYVTG